MREILESGSVRGIKLKGGYEIASTQQRLSLGAVFPIVLASIALFAGACGTAAESRKSKDSKKRDVQSIVDSYNERRLRAIEEIIKAEMPDDPSDKFLVDQSISNTLSCRSH